MTVKASSQTAPFDRGLQRLLALIVAFNVLPHVATVPIWVSIVAFSAIAWKGLYLERGIRLPKRWLLNIGSFIAASTVVVTYGTLFAVEPVAAILVLLASLKLLETNRHRDAMLVIFIGYFLLMTFLLQSQSLIATIYMAVDVLLITSLIFHAHKRDRRSSVRSFRPAMRLLAIALPVWVLLFVTFPRFTTALWNTGGSRAAGIGFSDSLDPGGIERLAEDDQPAFRVVFDNHAIPSPETLYWRGAVLDVGDGLEWHRSGHDALDNFTEPSDTTGEVAYDLWLEPGFQKWLFVLDFPGFLDAGVRGRVQQIHPAGGHTYEAEHDVQSRLYYSATATETPGEQTISSRERNRFLQLPKKFPTRLEELVVSLKRGSSDPEELSRRLIDWFQREHFRYSLSPGALGGPDGVAKLADFLFDRKVGFCEHYAAAFATLMRAMGVPARIVVGFQGGKINEYGDYLLVRRLDAHAWTEIWEPSAGQELRGHWRRVDPTGYIAPLRLQLGGDFNRLDPSLARALSGEELRARLQTAASGLDQRFSFMLDDVQMKWNAFLLSYDFNYQLSLLSALGLGQGQSIFFMLSGLFFGLLLIAASMLWLMRRRAHHKDILTKDWERFCRHLERAGITRRPTEGPLDFSERAGHRVSGLAPQTAAEIRDIGRRYASLRYGKRPPTTMDRELQEFRQSVRRLSKRTISRDTLS